METATSIFKIGAIIVKDKKLLIVRKTTKDNRVEYIIPGGRIEGDETHEETLRRELKEELRVEIVNMQHFGSFDETAVFENIPIHMEVYTTNITGTPMPDSEIKEYIWISRDYEKENIKLGSVLALHIIPRLTKLGLM